MFWLMLGETNLWLNMQLSNRLPCVQPALGTMITGDVK